jgi:hypothetical protein
LIAIENDVDPATAVLGETPLVELIEGAPAEVTVKMIALEAIVEPPEAPALLTVTVKTPATAKSDDGIRAVRLVELE